MSESRTIRCYNLTDIETPDLKRRGLVNQTIAVRSTLIRPGESKDLPDDATTQRDLRTYREVGVVAIDQLPLEYAAAKGRQAPKRTVRVDPVPEKPVINVAPVSAPEEKKA